MKIRSRSTLFFTLLIAVPSALFLGWDGYTRGSDIDMIIAVLGLLFFLRVMQDAISQKSYDADIARLQREKTVRYATYGRLAPAMPYIPGILLVMIFLSPVTTEDTMAPYLYLGLTLVAALQQLVVYLYVCHKMGLWDIKEG